MSLIFGEFFKLKKTSLECTSQEQQKFKPRHCVLECSEKVIIYNTFLDATVCIQTKNRKQKHLYIKSCLNVTYVLKPKTENKNITQDYMIVCQFLYFYNLPFAFINYTFCFNSISMGFC